MDFNHQIEEIDETVETAVPEQEVNVSPGPVMPDEIEYTNPETGVTGVYVAKKKMDDYHKLQDQYDACDAARLLALADMENMRKRFIKEKEAINAYQGREMFGKLSPVFNNIYTVMTAAERMSEETPLRGVWNDTVKTLASAGITVVEPAIGDEFNTDIMAAVMSVGVPEEDNVKPGAVALVISPAYKMGDTVLMYANVAVAKSPEE